MSTDKPNTAEEDKKKPHPLLESCNVAKEILTVVDKGIDVAKKLFGRESSHSIAEIKKQDGFSQFHIELETEVWRGIREEKLGLVLKIIFRRYFGMEVGKHKPLIEMVECQDIADVFPEDGFLRDTIFVDFNNGSGVTHQGQLVIEMDCSRGLANVAFFRLNGSFTLAPNLIIERHSKKSCFRSKSWETIRSEPRPLTHDDIAFITGSMSQQIINSIGSRSNALFGSIQNQSCAAEIDDQSSAIPQTQSIPVTANATR